MNSYIYERRRNLRSRIQDFEFWAKKKSKHKKQRKADIMHVRGREAVRTETKAAGFKQRIGYGGNGVKAITAEESASIG